MLKYKSTKSTYHWTPKVTLGWILGRNFVIRPFRHVKPLHEFHDLMTTQDVLKSKSTHKTFLNRWSKLSAKKWFSVDHGEHSVFIRRMCCDELLCGLVTLSLSCFTCIHMTFGCKVSLSFLNIYSTTSNFQFYPYNVLSFSQKSMLFCSSVLLWAMKFYSDLSTIFINSCFNLFMMLILLSYFSLLI